MSPQRLQGCRKANRAKLRGDISAGKNKIGRPTLITPVRFSQERWGGDKSSRGNQIFDTGHLARGDRKRRCLSQFYMWVVFCRLRHLGVRRSISVTPITDKSRLEDKATTLKRAGGAAKGGQSSRNEEEKCLSQRTRYQNRETWRTELRCFS